MRSSGLFGEPGRLLRSARPLGRAVANAVEALAGLLAPPLQLWPWLCADIAFGVFLLTSQGHALAADFAQRPLAPQYVVAAVAVSFLLSLAACLFTSLALTSESAARHGQAAV